MLGRSVKHGPRRQDLPGPKQLIFQEPELQMNRNPGFWCFRLFSHAVVTDTAVRDWVGGAVALQCVRLAGAFDFVGEDKHLIFVVPHKPGPPIGSE
jgi:hypothetical protein